MLCVFHQCLGIKYIRISTLLSLLFRDPGVGDGDDDIIFEDFARLRLKAGESDAWKHFGAGSAPAKTLQVLRTHTYVTCE